MAVGGPKIAAMPTCIDVQPFPKKAGCLRQEIWSLSGRFDQAEGRLISIRYTAAQG